MSALTMKELQHEAHANACEKGWWEGVEITTDVLLAKLMLIATEVAEAAEDVRVGELAMGSEGGKPVGLPSELADVVIRTMDLCGQLGIDLEDAVIQKMAYNRTRPHRHGGKLA